MAVCVPECPAVGEPLMEEVCERENLRQALSRVRAGRARLKFMDKRKLRDTPLNSHTGNSGQALDRGSPSAARMVSIELLKVYTDWRKLVYCVPVCHSFILAIDQTLADIAEQVPDFNAHESGRKGSQGILGVTELSCPAMAVMLL